MARSSARERARTRMRDGVEQIVEARALRQRQLPERVQRLALRTAPAAPRGRARSADACRVADGSRAGGAARPARRSRVGGTAPSRRRSTSDTFTTITAWCAVMRAAGFGDHVRRRQLVLGAGLGQRLHQGVRELVEAVVDRAEAARARAFVVHAQAAADVHVADRAAELAQLDEVAHRLAHAVGDVAHVGDLRAHVEVQQLQRIEQVGGAQLLDQVEHLARRQPELGLVAAAVLPLAGAERGQAHAHAEAAASTPSAAASSITSVELGRLSRSTMKVSQAELAADQRQADDTRGPCSRCRSRRCRACASAEHRHQLGLGAGLEAEAFAALRGQLAGHAVVLVDLDRIDRGVAAGVIPARPSRARTRPAACAGGRRGCRRSAAAAAA